jgi:hypothetical protein
LGSLRAAAGTDDVADHNPQRFREDVAAMTAAIGDPRAT